MKIVRIIIIAVLALLFGTCKQNSVDESTNPPIVVDDTLKPMNYYKRFHGYWRNNDTSLWAYPQIVNAYFMYDTTRSIWNRKMKYPFNFKSEIDGVVVIDSLKILWKETLNWNSLYGFYRFSKNDDSLFIYSDSLMLTNKEIWIKVSPTEEIANWTTRLTKIEISPLNVFANERFISITYYNSNWYLLTEKGTLLSADSMGNMNYSFSYTFKEASAFEIKDGILWIAGKNYLEKRTLEDTMLLNRYDLSKYYDIGYLFPKGVTVTDNSIFIVGSLTFLSLSLNGEYQWKKDFYSNICDLVYMDKKLYTVIEGNISAHMIDTLTVISKTSYTFDTTVTINNYSILPYFVALATRNGKLVSLDIIGQGLRIWETEVPN